VPDGPPLTHLYTFYVAAMGRLWSPIEDRGEFKTTDFGTTGISIPRPVDAFRNEDIR